MSEKYHDQEGNERSIHWMVKNEPEWAASIIESLRAQLSAKEKEIEGMRKEYLQALHHIDWFTAHLMSQYAKVKGINKQHIDGLYLSLNDRLKTFKILGKKAKSKKAKER